MTRHFLSVSDVTEAEALHLLEAAEVLKGQRHNREAHPLAGKSVALLFQHPSLRTKMSFDVAAYESGAHPIYMGNDEVKMGERESPADVARVLSRYVDAIVARLRSHAELEQLAAAATVPVINALTDVEHPCQALADLQTLLQRQGSLAGKHLVYLGDADNNVATSLLLLAPRLGVSITLACPEAYGPAKKVLEAARVPGAAPVCVVHDVTSLDLSHADALYTDVWVSMGQEQETAVRKAALQPYQLNAALLARTPAHCIVLHCLPAKRGQEITAEVLEGSQSAVFDQAENRLHSQKAILQWLVRA